MASSEVAPSQTNVMELTSRRAHSDDQRVALMHLSDDVLVIIAGFLGDEKLCSLLHLAMCSRRLHAIAEPIMYRTFWQGERRDTRMLQFICRIVARPDLACQVLSFRGNTGDVGLGCPKIQEEDMIRIRAAIQGISKSEADVEDWVYDIRKGKWDAIVVFFLSLLPNLQDLRFRGWPFTVDEEYPRLTRFLQRAADLQNRSEASPLAMSNVHSASLQYWDTKNGMQVDAILPLLNLKSVTSFDGARISGKSLKWFTPSTSFGIKELSLQMSVFEHRVMTPFLRCFPILERLSYEHGGALIGEADFEPPKMMKAIEHLKPCLEELIVISSDPNGGYDAELSNFPIGSLAEFQKLTSIEMTISILLGHPGNDEVYSSPQFKPHQRLVEAIPPSLQSLALRSLFTNEEPWAEIKDQIVELIANKQRYAPELKYLDIQWEKIKYPDKPSPPGPFLHKGFTKEEAVRLLAECEATGVEMVMKIEPPKPKFVMYTKQGEKKGNGIAIPIGVSHIVHYPYTEYEKLCEEHGCDPATGRRPGAWF